MKRVFGWMGIVMFAGCRSTPAGHDAGATSVGSATATKPRSGASVVDISFRGDAAYAVLSDGSVWTWGKDGYATIEGTKRGTLTKPARVRGIDDAVKVDDGIVTTCVVRKTGAAACWGENSEGQLAAPERASSDTPVSIPGLSSVAQISVRGHTCATMQDGTLWCWGNNMSGELGDGTVKSTPDGETRFGRPSPFARPAPAPVVGLTGVAEVGVGQSQTCARTKDGRVACWGKDAYAMRHGNNLQKVERARPVFIAGISSASRLAVLAEAACAIVESGKVVCWGVNKDGLGTGESESATPQAVRGLSDVVDLAASQSAVCASTRDGRAFCWGGDDWGRLGDIANVHSTPFQVPNVRDVEQIAVGCARLRDGTVTCWGPAAGQRVADGVEARRIEW